MSLQEVYDNPEISTMEEKFSVIRNSDTEFVGKYPLETFAPGARGTYGGELVSQGLLVAWESVEGKEFTPHSFHLYFLAAGLGDLVMRWEVTMASQGKNYCSRMVRCYQLHTEKLVFMQMVSFVKNNLVKLRKEAFAALSEQEQFHPRTKVPFEFLRKPHYIFDKYMKNVDDLPSLQHTNGNLTHAIPPEVLKVSSKDRNVDPGSRELGLFFKVNDDLSLTSDKLRAQIIDLTFASDSFYLGTLPRALGLLVMDKLASAFFRVSLDHTVYFHDLDFDPTQWMFLDYKFVRMTNDRVLVIALVFTPDRRLVATIQQEALAFIPLNVVERMDGGTYKL